MGPWGLVIVARNSIFYLLKEDYSMISQVLGKARNGGVMNDIQTF